MGEESVAARSAESMAGINSYWKRLSRRELRRGRHREEVGGAWDEIGPLQCEYLVQQGLQPQHRLIDVGCGAMRGGIHFARYLDPGNYYGIDVNDTLIDAALRLEVPAAGLADRVPAGNLKVTDDFNSDFGVAFDYALAQSVFTHLPLNHIRLCLTQLAKVMAPGGRFFVTFFEVPDDHPYDADCRQVAVTTHSTRDPFHYPVAHLRWAAAESEWDFHHIGDWGHPRGQRMVEYRRR